MFSRIFNHTNLLGKSLDVMALREEVLAHNIANNDTPNYKTQHVEFEAAFRQALLNQNEQLELKVSQPRHITVNPAGPLDVDPVVVSQTWHTMRMDGNNVDIDQQMNELAMNTIRYDLMIQQVSGELGRLKLAITG